MRIPGAELSVHRCTQTLRRKGQDGRERLGRSVGRACAIKAFFGGRLACPGGVEANVSPFSGDKYDVRPTFFSPQIPRAHFY